MTGTRSMQGTENPASNAEQLAHPRTAVERWLAWSGLVPLPAFLALHVTQELGRAFARDVAEIARPERGAFELLSSALLVWAPLLLHVTLAGWQAMTRGVPQPRADDVPRLARSLSRSSSLAALAFIAYHTGSLLLPELRGEAAHADSGFRLIALLSSTTSGVPLTAAIYLLGLLATATHAGLAIHRGLLGEGLLRTPPRRQRSGRLCATFAVLAFLLGAAAVIRVASGVLLR